MKCETCQSSKEMVFLKCDDQGPYWRYNDLGWSLVNCLMCVSIWMIVLYATFPKANAQVVMQQAFIPIGVSDAPYISGGAWKVPLVFKGQSETGDDIYAESELEADYSEFVEFLIFGATHVSSGVASQQKFNGMGNTEGFIDYAQTSAYVGTDLGLCQLAIDELPEGLPVLSAAWEVDGSLLKAVDMSWHICTTIIQSAFPDWVNLEVLFRDDTTCVDSSEYTGSLSAFLGGWYSNQDVICASNESDDITTSVPAEDYRNYSEVEQEEVVALTPPPLLKDYTLQCAEDFVAFGNHCMAEDLVDLINLLRGQYEAAGDIGDVDGGSTEEPDCLGGCFDPPTGDDDGEGADLCATNPNVVACEELDESLNDEFVSATADLDSAFSGVTDFWESATDDINTYVFGDGPELGLAPAGCPLEGGLLIEGFDFTLNTDAFCDLTGGPLKQLIAFAATIAAAMILIRGVSQ